MIDYSYDPQDRAANLSRMFREDLLSFGYAVTGAVLGVLAGIAVATNAVPARVHAESHSVVVASSSSAVLNRDARRMEASGAIAPEVGQATVAVAASPNVATVATSNQQNAPLVAKSEVKPIIINHIKDGGAPGSMESAPGQPATASSAPAAANLDAKVEKLAEPSHFSIEGDATVVEYDEPQGIITTDAATTFAIAKTGDKGSDNLWADFPVTVHYKCDGAAKCTLYHAGVLVAQASRPSQSDRLSNSVASVQMGQSSVPQDLQQMHASAGTR